MTKVQRVTNVPLNTPADTEDRMTKREMAEQIAELQAELDRVNEEQEDSNMRERLAGLGHKAKRVFALTAMAVVAGLVLVALFGGSSASASADTGVCEELAKRTVCAPAMTPKGGALVEIREDGVAVYDNGGKFVAGKFRPGRG